MMGIFYQEPSRKCKCFLASALKHALAKCHSLGRFLHSTPQPDEPPTDYDEQEEEEIFVSAVISKYMESKSKRRSRIFDSIYWAVSPNEAEPEEEYFSAAGSGQLGSELSNSDAFMTAKSTCLSEFEDLEKRRLMFMELIECKAQGWPFGLCRKALLLPPLPKSPPDSWLWTKTGRIIKFIL